MSRHLHMIAGLILASLAIMPSGCSNSDDGDASPASVVTSGPNTHDLFVYGTITDHGKPVADARVDVQLEPEREAAEAKVGDTIELFSADSVHSDQDGRFALHLQADEVPTKYFLSGRDRSTLNFQLMVFAPSQSTTWSSTLYSVGNPKVWRTDKFAVPADAALKMEFDLGSDRVTLTYSNGETEDAAAPVLAAVDQDG